MYDARPMFRTKKLHLQLQDMYKCTGIASFLLTIGESVSVLKNDSPRSPDVDTK